MAAHGLWHGMAMADMSSQLRSWLAGIQKIVLVDGGRTEYRSIRSFQKRNSNGWLTMHSM